MCTFPLPPHTSSHFFFLPLADLIRHKSKETNMSLEHWSCLSAFSSIAGKKSPEELSDFKWLFSMEGGGDLYR